MLVTFKYSVMRTSIIIACLIIYGFHNSVEAQSPLPLSRKPTKSEITLYSGPDNMIGALFLLKDSSILVSKSLVTKDYDNGNYEVAELYIDDINLIRSKRRLGPLNGAILGLLVGAGVGALTARIVEGPPPEPSSNYSSWDFGLDFSGMSYYFFIPTGAVAGAITGGIIGCIKIKIPINGSMENYNRNKKKLGRYTVKYDGSPTY
jgi:hypothetical protein